MLQPDGHLLHAGSAPPAAPGPGRIAVDVPIRMPDHLAPLTLSLRLEADEASTGATFASGVPAYAAVGLAALVAVLMGSQALGRRLTRPLRELERVAATIVDALCRLLEALLDVSKLDAGVVSANPRPVRLADVVERLESEYRLRMQAKGLSLRAVPSSLLIRTDRDLLERILRNLLENALRYTDRGGIVIGCRRRGDRVLIVVVDTGSGIPPEHLDRIFHEFYQVSNPARDRGLGLGLGLAIVERLVRLLDGRIHVTSTPGRGSCFSIEFRRSADDGAASPRCWPRRRP